MHILQEMTPVDLEGAVRRSSRNTLAPKRLKYSPERNTEDETQTKKRVRGSTEKTQK